MAPSRDYPPEILNYVNGAELGRYSQIGVVTPDHNIRTKNMPLLLPAAAEGRLDGFRAAASAALGCRTVTTLSGSVIPKKKELISKFQIGSIKGECNYMPEQQAFHITNVPPEKLAMIEQAEGVLRDAGFREVRVRHHEQPGGALAESGQPRQLRAAVRPRLRQGASGRERADLSRKIAIGFRPHGTKSVFRNRHSPLLDYTRRARGPFSAFCVQGPMNWTLIGPYVRLRYS